MMATVKQKELISVIIPTYKRTEEFERALNSVLCQTYDNMEIIVVDDNAENLKCRNEVQQIVMKHKGVKLIQNPKNMGGALSRNIGVDNANGELIAFLDDDDEFMPDKLKKQFDLYLKHRDEDIGLVFCNNDWINYDENLLYQHMKRIIATTSTWLIPKKVIKNLGYFEKLPSEQDTTFILRMLCNNYKVINVSENLVIRHFHKSKDGISGVKPENIIGTELLRQKCRGNYDKLDNAKQIKDVEYCFSKKMLSKYIYNNKKKEAKMELKNMLTTKPFNINTIKGVLKYLFPSIFVFNWGL